AERAEPLPELEQLLAWLRGDPVQGAAQLELAKLRDVVESGAERVAEGRNDRHARLRQRRREEGKPAHAWLSCSGAGQAGASVRTEAPWQAPALLEPPSSLRLMPGCPAPAPGKPRHCWSLRQAYGSCPAVLLRRRTSRRLRPHGGAVASRGIAGASVKPTAH